MLEKAEPTESFIDPYVDGVLTGWAWRPGDPGRRVLVKVCLDNKPTAAGFANLPRRDMAALGQGDGQYGFSIPLPPSHVSQTITLFDAENGQQLASPPPISKISIGQKPSAPVIGSAGVTTGATIKGWCWLPGRPSLRPRIQAILNGRQVATTEAEPPHGDFAITGIDDGLYTFSLQIPLWLLNGEEHQIAVEVIGYGPLTGSPVLFAALAEGPRPLLDRIAAAIPTVAQEPLLARDLALLRLYLKQGELLLPASVSFGWYDDWLDSVAPAAPKANPPHFTTGREGFREVSVQIHHPVLGPVAVFLDRDCTLHPGAFHRALDALAASGRDMLYADADRIKPDGWIEPWFRPDWSYDLFLSQDYIQGLFVTKLSAMKGIPPCRTQAELRARILLEASPDRIYHLPEVLARLEGPGDLLGPSFAVADHLATRGLPSGSLQWINEEAGLRRVTWPLPTPLPTISLIIPTRDRLDLLATAVESILTRTRYPDFEIIIIDNQSREAETRAWLENGVAAGRFRVMPYDAPFNYADMNNRAAALAKGSVLGFINNDVELITEEWLNHAATLLHRQEVGAVGARLRFANGMVQHAGVVIGTGGLAENVFQHCHVEDEGYFHRLQVNCNYSAVTAAALFCRKSDFTAIGGFDAANLPVAFNDVDMCLRLRERGKLIVWTPEIELYHYESVSRGHDATSERKLRASKEHLYMRRRWQHVALNDPYYSPNLNLDHHPFSSLALPPRHRWGTPR